MINDQFNLIISVLNHISIPLWIIAGVQLGQWIFDIIDRISEGEK